MNPVLALVCDVVMLALLLSLAFVTIRLLRGPTVPDRAVASDQVAIHVVALIVVYSIRAHQPGLLDLVIVTAIVGFMTVTVIGIYIERAVFGKARTEPGDQLKR